MLLGFALVLVSVFLRFAGVVLFRVLCGTYGHDLFEPISRARPLTHVALFPGFSPDEFDNLLRQHWRRVIPVLPPKAQSLAWWRIGLRNWSRGFFWLGVFLLLVRPHGFSWPWGLAGLVLAAVVFGVQEWRVRRGPYPTAGFPLRSN